MRSRGLLMLLVAVVAGALAVLLALRWMTQQNGNRQHVAVANTDIELGSRITTDMIRLVDWPRDSMPPGAFTTSQQLDGRVVLTAVRRGEPLLESRLAPVGSKGGLSAVVPEGKRAMTVRVNDVIGVAGFALPGTYVDIMVNTQADGSQRSDKDRSISKIVLERILVLAVAQEADRDTTKPKVVNAVTLEVTPQEAEVLDLARSIGTLSLVLRNQTDPKMAATEGATKAELLGQAPPPAPTKAAAPVRKQVATKKPEVRFVPTSAPPKSQQCVEVIRGLNKVTECF